MKTAQWAAGRLELKVHQACRELNLALFQGIQRIQNLSLSRLRAQALKKGIKSSFTSSFFFY